MRALALAAIVGVGVTLGGVAAARPWSDPNGRINFDAPSSWVMEVRRATPQTIVLAGNASNECYLLATPNSRTASASPDAARRATDPITADAWLATANSLSPMFPGSSARLVSQSVDTSGFWPIQRAELQSPERPVIAALSSRPGMDLMAFCWTYDGPDATARYEAVFRSISHPNDAAWQAQAEQQATDREAQAQANAAAQAAAAQQQAEQQQQQNRRR